MTVTPAVHQGRARGVTLEAGHRHAAAQIDAVGAQGVEQQHEQGTAVHAEPAGALGQVAVGHVHHGPPSRGLSEQALDAGPGVAQRRGQADALQRRHARGLEQQPGADRQGVTEALEHLDRVPGAMEEERRGSTGRAAPYDPDPQDPARRGA